MKLLPLHRDLLAPLWPLVAPFARQMAERFPDDWPLPEIRRRAEEGLLLLWLVWEEAEGAPCAVVATEIHDKPSGRRQLLVALAAGRAHERWVRLIAELERHGRRHGCHYAEVSGRAGWARHLPDYRPERGAILRKELH